MDETILHICVDCWYYVMGAAAELPERDFTAQSAAVARVARDNHVPVSAVMFEPDNEETGHFSWNRCDLCLSALGGDRFPVVLDIYVPDSTTEGA